MPVLTGLIFGIAWMLGYAGIALLVNEAVLSAHLSPRDASDELRLAIALFWPLAFLASGAIWMWHKLTDDSPIIQD